MLPLGTKGNTHTPKVYANVCQNVCITHDIYNNFKDGNVSY